MRLQSTHTGSLITQWGMTVAIDSLALAYFCPKSSQQVQNCEKEQGSSCIMPIILLINQLDYAIMRNLRPSETTIYL